MQLSLVPQKYAISVLKNSGTCLNINEIIRFLGSGSHILFIDLARHWMPMTCFKLYIYFDDLKHNGCRYMKQFSRFCQLESDIICVI